MHHDDELSVYVYEPEKCPLTATLRAIGAKWKGVIWWRLSNGIGRYGELRRALPQITKKMLTQQLREMERDGIVHRKIYAEVPQRVEYSLTTYGLTLKPVIDVLCQWGATDLERTATGVDDRMSISTDEGRPCADQTQLEMND